VIARGVVGPCLAGFGGDAGSGLSWRPAGIRAGRGGGRATAWHCGTVTIDGSGVAEADPEDLREACELLGLQHGSERDLDEVLAEKYSRLSPEPDCRLDLDYVVLSRGLAWGAAAAASGVIGNAIYDGAKSAVVAFLRRHRRDKKSVLTRDEVTAFSLYALAYLVHHKPTASRIWRDDEPPGLVSATPTGHHLTCRFEQCSDTTYMQCDAIWVEIVDIKIDGNAPRISNTQYRTSTDLRLAVTPHQRWMRRTTGIGGLDKRGLGERQVTDWTAITGSPPSDYVHGCGV
jgi:hypothetical protein